MTRTAHPLKFKTYADESGVTVPNSMQILGTGTRDVQILAPLKCYENTTFDTTVNVTGVLKLTSDIRIVGPPPSDGIIISKPDGVELFKVSSEYTRSVENIVGLKIIEAVANLTVGGASDFSGTMSCNTIKSKTTAGIQLL